MQDNIIGKTVLCLLRWFNRLRKDGYRYQVASVDSMDSILSTYHALIC